MQKGPGKFSFSIAASSSNISRVNSAESLELIKMESDVMFPVLSRKEGIPEAYIALLFVV